MDVGNVLRLECIQICVFAVDGMCAPFDSCRPVFELGSSVNGDQCDFIVVVYNCPPSLSLCVCVYSVCVQ